MTSNLFVFQSAIAIKARTCAFKQSYYYTCICLFEMLFILDLYGFLQFCGKMCVFYFRSYGLDVWNTDYFLIYFSFHIFICLDWKCFVVRNSSMKTGNNRRSETGNVLVLRIKAIGYVHVNVTSNIYYIRFLLYCWKD